MLIELIMATLIVAFLLVATLGHVLLAAAIYKCLREDYVNGRGRRAPARTRALRAATWGAPPHPAASLKPSAPRKAETGADLLTSYYLRHLASTGGWTHAG
jgi:hypothetical protein